MLNSDSTTVRYKLVYGCEAYRVGDDGSVWSRRTPRGLRDEWKQLAGGTCGRSRQYRFVLLRLDGEDRFHPRLVHRMVLEMFVGPCPKGMEACHGKGFSNKLDNLRWGTHKSNAEDMVRDGLSLKGSDHHKAKVTSDDVITIRKMRASGMTLKQVALEFNLSLSQISRICKGEFWKHIQEAADAGH